MLQDCYRFGRFELQCTRRQLLVEGHASALGARAFDLLRVLVERHGSTVTKNQLLDLVWPESVVEENNLAVHVSALRKLLGSETIATIPGRGYRLAVPLDDESALHEAPVTLSTPVTGLPMPTAALLGRTRDVEAVDEMLGGSRLVTVLGPGGMGKTSVALAAAHAAQGAHRDGACWVDLAPVAQPEAVPAAVAQGLQISLSGGDPMCALLAALKPLQLLLVLDNAEPVAAAVARLAQAILRATSDVHLLVTSQVALKLDSERVFMLGPLSVPPLGTSAALSAEHGAIALFVEQARAVDRRFQLSELNAEQAADLCRRVDGLPLAIKLAAARVPVLGLDGVASRLDERFKLLASTNRDAPPRQRTLQAALDWSHALLGPRERAVFRRLGVFVGGFSLELAAAVACDDAIDEWAVIDCLEALVDHSLVSVDAGDRPRYRLLESAREYAQLRQVEAGESESLQRRHALALLELFERAYEEGWVTPDAQWISTYGPEIENVRSALDWASLHDPPIAVALYGASYRIFLLQSVNYEARRRGVELESAISPQVPAAAAARYWVQRAMTHLEVDHAISFRCGRNAEELFQRIGDTRGRYCAMAMMVATGIAPLAEAQGMFEELSALEQPGWPPRVLSRRPWANIWLSFRSGQTSQVRTPVEAMLRLTQASQAEFHVQSAQLWLVTDLMRAGESDEAERLCRVLVSVSRRRNLNELLAPAVLAAALLMKGQAVEARPLLVEFTQQSRVRDWEQFALVGYYLALLATVEGRNDDAARLFGYADEAFARMDASWLSAANLRPRVEAALQAALDRRTLQHLMDEGARLDEEGACSLAFRTEPHMGQNA